MVKIFCSYCGKEYEPKTYHKKAKNHFCSKVCEGNFRRNKPKQKKKTNKIDILEKYAIINIHNNINGDFECIIDIDDVEKVKNYFWNIRYDKRHPNCTVYVESHSRKDGKPYRIHLHRLIMNCPDNMVVDHIDGNGLNNRKNNLRIITQTNNVKNKTYKKILGVYYNKQDKYWITMFANKIYGRYTTKKAAITKRNIINQLIKRGKFDELDKIKVDKLSDANNGLQRNNKTGVTGISQLKNGTFQVRWKRKYIATTKTLEDAIKTQQEYILANS